MSIVAQSADGTSHEFPDGTNPAVIDKVMKDYAQQIPQKPGSIVDSLRSLPGGLAQGAAGLAGLPGDVSHLLDMGMDKLTGGHVADAPKQTQIGGVTIPIGSPTSSQINDTISKPFGGYYEPQTTAGELTERAASFAPALVGGEATIPAKIMGRLLAPASGSLAAGSLADEKTSPVLHGALEAGGALLGGGLASGARSLGGALKDLKLPPEDVANKSVAKLVADQGYTPDTLAASAIPGRGQMASEALGPQGVAYHATLGRRPGTTGEALANALTTRAVEAPNRIMNDFTAASGIDPRAAQGNFDQLLESGAKRAEPLYSGAYKANQSISSPAIDRILETPAGRKAMSHASQMMQNDQSLVGVADPDLLEQAREAGQDIPWKGGVASGLKLRSLDYVKRALDDQIGSAFRAGNKTEGGILVGLKGKLVKALDDADVTAAAGPNSVKPEGGLYAQARGAAGDYLGAKEAFENGQAHILSTTVTPSDVTKYLAKLPPTAQEAYKGGIANRVLIQAQNGRLTGKILSTPAAQAKLSAALGPEKAQTFLDGVQQEISLAKSGGRMMPNTNSITADIGINTGEQDAAATINAGMHGVKAVSHALSGNPISAVGSTLTAIKHFAPDLLKTGGMSAEARNAAGKLLALPPEDLANHLRAMPTLPVKRGALAQLLQRNP